LSTDSYTLTVLDPLVVDMQVDGLSRLSSPSTTEIDHMMNLSK